ncbi:MAG: RNA polymerase sigma factor [Alphaproteobacteria bacterium]|nr:RNA polymerase sigma factor [Alphaproteobacteria bacterium]
MKIWKAKSSYDVVRAGIEPLFPRLWRYCLVLAGDKERADDLAQAACLRALEKADQFELGSHLDRWVFRLTHNLWINELRKQAVRVGGGLAAIEETELVDPKHDPEMNLLGREVLLGVMRLPEAQRAAVLLVYVEGYTYRDAAKVLNIPVGTVMSRLAVARGKLVEEFRDESEVG